jgi:hypothetical protein
MAKFWHRKAQQDTRNAQPVTVPADLVVWAREVDVSRLSDQTVRDAEDYLKGYRYMNLDLSQQMGWRVIAAVEAQVTPSPPADAQPLDVIATVLALRRKQLGTGLSSLSGAIMSSPGEQGACELGALGGTRTPNLLIRSQMLYPLSYERSPCTIPRLGP